VSPELSIAAVVPAFNEADRVGITVRALIEGVPGLGRVIVVDDGSTDRTGEVAAAAGAEVVRCAANEGKGAALRAGLATLEADGGADVVLLLDADLGETADQAAALAEQVACEGADLAIATFPPAGPAGFGLVKGLARLGIRRLGDPGFAASAPLSGQRALSRDALSAVTPLADGYGVEVAMTIAALRAGLPVVEVPTTMAHRATGRDAAGFAHRGRQFVAVAATLARLAARRR
jgi:hypothetical protein